MSPGTPQPEAPELFDQMSRLADDDFEGMERHVWRLRSLMSRQSGDYITRLAMAFGLLSLGDKDGALPHLLAAYGLRGTCPIAERINLMTTLNGAGQLQEARIVLEEIVGGPESRTDEVAKYNTALVALRAGDVNLIRRLADDVDDKNGLAAQSLDILTKNDFLDLFPEHQKIVEAHLAAHTLRFGAIITEGQNNGLALRYWTTKTGSERLQINRELHDSLRILCIEHGRDEGAFIGVVNFLISGLALRHEAAVA